MMSEAKKDESDLSVLLCAKRGLISIAARLAMCEILMEIEEVCENQKTISAAKLQLMLDKASNKMKDEAIHVRNMAMKISA
jgi:hypothetical protein